MGAGKSTIGRRIAEMLERAAFIDGDFVIELRPHISDHNQTREMQKDNILHISKNYSNFDKCDSVVLSWIVGENGTRKMISEVSRLNYKAHHFILTCYKEVLIERWHSDNSNDWRTHENLTTSLETLDEFNKRTDCMFIDTSNLSVDMVAEKIIQIVRTS